MLVFPIIDEFIMMKNAPLFTLQDVTWLPLVIAGE
jgi:hypothetical protein